MSDNKKRVNIIFILSAVFGVAAAILGVYYIHTELNPPHYGSTVSVLVSYRDYAGLEDYYQYQAFHSAVGYLSLILCAVSVILLTAGIITKIKQSRK